jgi:hypothetical protein
VDLLAVVPAQLLLLLGSPGAERLLQVAVGVLAANHEANLPGWVGGDRGVAVLDVGEDLLASLLEVGNERHVQPLVLGWLDRKLAEVLQSADWRMEASQVDNTLTG